jgi:hypothetical protein
MKAAPPPRPPIGRRERDTALVAHAANGPLHGGLLGELEVVDVDGLDGSALVDLMVACERLKARLDALQQVALAGVIDATESTGVDGDMARHEVGAALRLSPGTAYERTRVAADLTTRLPATLAALRAGRISYLQARAIVDAVRPLTDAQAQAVQLRVLTRCGTRTLAETRRALSRAVIAVDPAGAMARHETAHAARRVSIDLQSDAMAGLWATMSALNARQVWAALSDQARRSRLALRSAGSPDPGLEALRVDALVALVTRRSTGGVRPPDALPRGRRPAAPRCTCGGRARAAVVIDLPTLLGLAEHPGELPGYGPIPAPLARELAADCEWTRWTTDAGTRRLLDIGSHRYRPSARLAQFVAAGHVVCGFPGCSRPAAACDLDHVTDFRRGGPTDTTNIHPACRGHHNAKTHGGWHLHYDPETGIKTWISPLGKKYLKYPDPPLPDG